MSFGRNNNDTTTFMFIRFVSGKVDEDSHVLAGLFCAAYDLAYSGDIPRYEFEAVRELDNWFDSNLRSPLKQLPSKYNYDLGVCWFKPSAREHLARAWEMVMILERNDVLIWTIKATSVGRVYYEDDVQIFAEPTGYLRRVLKR